jgi:hypothetical protein
MSRQHRPVESTSRHSSCRQLDARWGSQRTNGHCHFRPFEHDRCLHIGEHRGERHYVYVRRDESLYHYSESSRYAHSRRYGDYEQLRACTDRSHYAVIRVYDDVGNANRGRLGYKQERPSQRNGHSCSGKLSRG